MDNAIWSAGYSTRFKLRSGVWMKDTGLGRGQWGLCQDDFGRLYFNYNSDMLRADLLPTEAFTKNPLLRTAASINAKLAADQTLYPSHPTPGVNRGYDAKTLSADGKLTRPTGTCGALIYRGDAFPSAYRGNAFVPEPCANSGEALHDERDRWPPESHEHREGNGIPHLHRRALPPRECLQRPRWRALPRGHVSRHHPAPELPHALPHREHRGAETPAALQSRPHLAHRAGHEGAPACREGQQRSENAHPRERLGARHRAASHRRVRRCLHRACFEGVAAKRARARPPARAVDARRPRSDHTGPAAPGFDRQRHASPRRRRTHRPARHGT
jgi:hypothetical protein